MNQSDLFDNQLLDSLPPDLRQRSVALNNKPVTANADYVLVWVQQTIRGYDNPLIDAGIAMANSLALRVLVYHGVRADYPHASSRLHLFLLQASRSLALDLSKRGVRCIQYVETDARREKGLVYRLAERAAVVLTDLHFTYVGKFQAEQFAAKAAVLTCGVDASRLVPTLVLPDGLSTTPAFRAANKAQREAFSASTTDLEPQQAPFDGELPYEPHRLADMNDDQLGGLVASCSIDHTLAPSDDFSGDRAAGLSRLEQAAETIVARYKWTRNNPALPLSTTRLSPYMHFGVLGPREVVARIQQTSLPAAARWKFFDELLTWREWSHYRALKIPDIHLWASLPKSSRKTLCDHDDDERPLLCTLDALIHGESSDPLWNAAQRQWLVTGWMHNNLRMYWSKRLIALTPSSRHAWAAACYLNDRLSLDGRDPATYASMRWAFGDGKPGYREQPIYGWIMPKSSRALLKRDGVEAFIAEYNDMTVARVAVPDWDLVLDWYG